MELNKVYIGFNEFSNLVDIPLGNVVIHGNQNATINMMENMLMSASVSDTKVYLHSSSRLRFSISTTRFATKRNLINTPGSNIINLLDSIINIVKERCAMNTKINKFNPSHIVMSIGFTKADWFTYTDNDRFRIKDKLSYIMEHSDYSGVYIWLVLPDVDIDIDDKALIQLNAIDNNVVTITKKGSYPNTYKINFDFVVVNKKLVGDWYGKA